MSTKFFQLLKRSEFSFDSTKVEFREAQDVRLLKTEQGGDYSPVGRYRQPADIVFPNWSAAGLVEFFAFEEISDIDRDEEGNELGSIGWQVSVDGGTSWKFWTGTSWATAGANDFSPHADLDSNINSLAFPAGGTKQLRLKARLTPSADLAYTPRLREALVHHEVMVNWFEDVQRSLRRFLLDNFKARLSVRQKLVASSTTIILNTDFHVDSVVGVWNETTDPGHLTNLFSSLTRQVVGHDENGEPIEKVTLTLTSSQAAASLMFIVFLGVPPVIIAPADEELHLATVPALVFRVDPIAEHLPSRDFSRKVENNFARNKARIREQSTAYQATVIVNCADENDLNAINMAEGLQRLIKKPGFDFPSLATGEVIALLDYTPFMDTPVRPLGLAVKEATFILYGFSPDEEFTEKDDAYADSLILDKVFNVGGQE